MSLCRMSVVCQINCVGGITCGTRTCSKFFLAVKPQIKEYNGIGNAIEKLCDHAIKRVPRRVTRKNIKKVLRILLKRYLSAEKYTF